MVSGVSRSPNHYGATYIGNGPAGESSSNVGAMNGAMNGYTLMVAGRRTGKTSFLRLLLDTSEVSRTATKDQLTSVAKFVQGCSGHTSHIRTASIDVELDVDGSGRVRPLALTVVDTPSLDFTDEASSERIVSEMLRYVESRLAEGLEDVSFSLHAPCNFYLNLFFLHRSGRPGLVIIIFTCTYSDATRQISKTHYFYKVYIFLGPRRHCASLCPCTTASSACLQDSHQQLFPARPGAGYSGAPSHDESCVISAYIAANADERYSSSLCPSQRAPRRCPSRYAHE
jgi:hypothetical protein